MGKQKADLLKIKRHIEGIMDELKRVNPSGIHYSEYGGKPEEAKLELAVLRDLEEKLYYSDIAELTKPIKLEGVLVKNGLGRYEIKGTDYDYTSGQGIEALIPDHDDGFKWVITRVEHNGDYYLYGYKEIPLDGLHVRVRER